MVYLLKKFLGVRSGRGILIYPDGSYYEGYWRKNARHGKGRYIYYNGDAYCGGWYRGQRHGVGVYTNKKLSSNAVCGPVSFIGTWRNGIRVGPFQLNFGTEDKLTTLHGTWDNLYPQGPALFNFHNEHLLMGYFQTSGREAWSTLQANKKFQAQGSDFLEEFVNLEETRSKQKMWSDEPPLWYAQDMSVYKTSLLPQEPVPVPISDSELSVCSLSTTASEVSKEKTTSYVGESELQMKEEADMECIPCKCLSSSGIESSSQICPPAGEPCAIEISPTNNC